MNGKEEKIGTLDTSLNFPRHEDLYARLQKHLIRSDDLFNDSLTFKRLSNGSCMAPCMLNMLSDPTLDQIGVFDLLLIERLVVDEASQIDTFEFMVRWRHRSSHTYKIN